MQYLDQLSTMNYYKTAELCLHIYENFRDKRGSGNQIIVKQYKGAVCGS